jgi:hypothetical protein
MSNDEIEKKKFKATFVNLTKPRPGMTPKEEK